MTVVNNQLFGFDPKYCNLSYQCIQQLIFFPVSMFDKLSFPIHLNKLSCWKSPMLQMENQKGLCVCERAALQVHGPAGRIP